MSKRKQKLTYVDLFAWCGGLSLGLFNSSLWHGTMAIEKNAMAFETLRHNLIAKEKHFSWPESIPCGAHDINELLEKNGDFLVSLRGKIDLVAGGPPCQWFSTAWKREEDDWRNTLVNSYIAFVEAVRPRALFFENVRWFDLEFKKYKDKGRRFSHEVIDLLERLWYDTEGRLLDFSAYGIPQARKRFILVGIRKDVCEKTGIWAKNFYELLDGNSESFLAKKGLTRSNSLHDAIGDLKRSHGEVASADSEGFTNGVYGQAATGLQLLLRGKITISSPDSHRFARHGEAVISRFERRISAFQANMPFENWLSTKKRSQIVLDRHRPSPTLTTLPDDYIHYEEPRILTVREYARIQTFNDWFEVKGKYTTWGTLRKREVPRYTQIGNAIPPLFAEQVGEVFYKILWESHD